jgi:hypothetical protein
MFHVANSQCGDPLLIVLSSMAVSGPVGLQTWLIFYQVVSNRKEAFFPTYLMVLILVS